MSGVVLCFTCFVNEFDLLSRFSFPVFGFEGVWGCWLIGLLICIDWLICLFCFACWQLVIVVQALENGLKLMGWL